MPLRQIADESKESEGWIFNVIDSKASSTGNHRTGARWFEHERGRLVEIPVDFNLEPVDIVSALTEPHLYKIRGAFEDQLVAVKEDLDAQFHCPSCGAALI